MPFVFRMTMYSIHLLYVLGKHRREDLGSCHETSANMFYVPTATMKTKNRIPSEGALLIDNENVRLMWLIMCHALDIFLPFIYHFSI